MLVIILINLEVEMEGNWEGIIDKVTYMPGDVKEKLLERLTEELFLEYQIHNEIVGILRTLDKKQLYGIYLVINDIVAHNRNISKAVSIFKKEIERDSLTLEERKFLSSLNSIESIFSECSFIPIELVEALIPINFFDFDAEILSKEPPKPRFVSQRWFEKVNVNFQNAVRGLLKKRGDKVRIAKLISEKTGLSIRQSERYLDGESDVTAEVILMFEEVLNIHRDQLLGDFISSESGSNTRNINDLKEFRILYSLMEKNEMLSEDIKAILSGISKIYSDLEIKTKSISTIDSIKNYELMRKTLTDFMSKLKGFTT